MSKQKLMLSAAAAALLTGSGHATTITCPTDTLCISSSTTDALTTSTAGGETTPQNVYVFNDSDNGTGSIKIGTESTAVVLMDSSHYVYTNGLLQNDGVNSAYGIRVDMSKNPDLSGASFPNVGNITQTGNAIFLDSSSSIYVTGKGTYKRAIFLDASNVGTSSTGVLKGNVVTSYGSTISVEGDGSYGILLSPSGELDGNLLLGGTMSVAPSTADSTTASNMFGVFSAGKIVGDVYLSGTLQSAGAGATGMHLAGQGVDGALRIAGNLVAQGCNTACSISANTSTKKVTYPEGGSALVIGSSITNGVYLSGTVQTLGTAPAVTINPAVASGAANQTTPVPLVIGIYRYRDLTDSTAALQYDASHPGFSFNNTGAVNAVPENYDNSAQAMGIYGSSATYQTTLTGGIFNSGSITATSSSTATDVNSNSASTSAVAMFIGSYVNVGGTGYNSTTGLYAPDYACAASGTCQGPTVDAYTGGGASLKTNGYDRAGLVNTGTIRATGNGTLASTTSALSIDANANLSSLINTGTIQATGAVNATRTDEVTTLNSYGIFDNSGSLTYIYNYGGTISASASVLDNDAQTAAAIVLNGNTATASGTGISIISRATASKSASIAATYSDGTYGTAIRFGSGDYQVLQVVGSSASYTSTVFGDVIFGSGGTHDRLHVGEYGYVTGRVTAQDGVDIQIDSHGYLVLLNDTAALNATRLYVDGNGVSGGNLAVSLSNDTITNGTVIVGGSGAAAPGAAGSATLKSGSSLGFRYGSFVPQGTTDYVLISAPHDSLYVEDFQEYRAAAGTEGVGDNGGVKPFLFQDASLTYYSNNCAGLGYGTTATGCVNTTAGERDRLVISVTPKTADQLGLTSYAAGIFPYANAAVVNDSNLGSAMISSINNEAEAQAAYQSFAPNITGGTRAIAVSITDQATGVVGAHQRALRMYARQSGGMTLWGNEFVQMIKDPGSGAVDPLTGYKAKPGFKDHGFGFAFGIDGGSPKYGWYGAALTFYTGDVNELSRDSHANQQWYILSAYSAWRGKGLFFDSKIDVGYGRIDTKRTITLGNFVRQANGKHAGELLSGGFSTGGVFSYGALTLMPQLSVDGLLLREEGYTEKNPSTSTIANDGFNLTMQPYYAKSLRAFLGVDVRYDIQLWEFYLQPEARAGYRYDFLSDPVKLKAAFAHADITGTSPGPGTEFEMTGPDPSQGNFVLGASLATTTDAWTLGLNFDVVRGSNGAFQQVGTINLLGRI